MGYERYGRGDPQRDYYRQDPQDRDYGSGRDYSSSSGREYQAAGEPGGRRDQPRGYGSEDRYGGFDRDAREGFTGGRDDYRDEERGRRVGIYGGDDDRGPGTR